jgi:type IV secretion system protein VirB6
MACPTVTTGDQFLAQTLGHLDCQAQTLGSFGFQALAAPGSPASLALSGLLTLFIALFAMRMLLGDRVQTRDAVNGFLKIGIVLTLAVSWPAFRILAYDTVLLGPAEVASSMTPSTLPDTGAGFTQRLQTIDGGMASLTLVGTGRQTGSLALEQRRDEAFRTIAMADETALGWARTIYLASVIGSLAILRVAGGLLLALTPLVAGLLLFDLARGLFAGWLRGLVLVALGSLGMTLLLAVQVAVMEPWLADALQRRSLGYATPSAPTELLALTLAFAIASAGLLFLLGKVAFQNAWSFRVPRPGSDTQDRAPAAAPTREPRPIEIWSHPRALTVSEGVMNLIRHEEGRRGVPQVALALPANGPSSSQAGANAEGRIGSSWRRTSGRTTAAQTQRDNRS